LPNAAAAAELNGGWAQWPNQNGGVVDQNELNQVIAQANVVVEQAIMQHPDAPQVIDTVSDEALNFYRAQGPPVTLELPLSNNSTEIVPYLNNNMDPESDFSVRCLAKQLGLHQVVGPAPSVQMLIQEVLEKAATFHHDLYIPQPISTGLASFEGLRMKWNAIQQHVQEKYHGYIVDSDDEIIGVDPFWGNNLEASSSSAPPPLLSLQWDARSTNSTNRVVQHAAVEIVQFNSNEVNRQLVLADHVSPVNLSSDSHLSPSPQEIGCDQQNSQYLISTSMDSDISPSLGLDISPIQMITQEPERTVLPLQMIDHEVEETVLPLQTIPQDS
jgi:hypothetical protein